MSRARPTFSHASRVPAIAQVPPVRERLSAQALKLHVFAVLVSIYEQHAGVVCQSYLDGLGDDTSTPLVELCGAGLWAPGDNGYLIAEAEVRRIAQIVHDQVRRPSDRRRT